MELKGICPAIATAFLDNGDVDYDSYRNLARTLINDGCHGILNHIRQDVEMIILFEKKILHRRGIIASDHCRKPGHLTDDIYLSLFTEYYSMIEPYFLKTK